jgi:carboxyl-terminal processing protease
MRNLRVWALSAPLLAVLGGCAGHPVQIAEDLAARTIESALEDIEDLYYRETDALTLVKAGLAAVEEGHSRLQFVQQNGSIVANLDETAVFEFQTAASRGEADVWGDRIAAALQHIATVEPEAGPEVMGLTDTFLHGVTNSLNKHTRYAPRARVETRGRSYSGRLGTLNIGLKREDLGWRIAYVFSVPLMNSRQLRKGDVILEIDGASTFPLSITDMFARLRGEVGSPISLTISRAGNVAPLVVRLEREVRDANSVAVLSNDADWHVLFTQFSGKSVDDMRALLSDRAPSDASGIILDLRDNPGGLLEPVVEFASLFLSAGRIADIHGRHQDSHQYFVARETAPAADLPLVVLIDGDSGAGAEIVAAALQANDRAIIVGRTSYGLGTIQTVQALPNAAELFITWGEVTTPGNYRLDKRGVMPTVCTGGTVTAEEVINALRSGGGVVGHATRIRDIDPEDTDAVEAFRSLCPPRDDGADDIALEVAKAILADPALYELILSPAL